MAAAVRAAEQVSEHPRDDLKLLRLDTGCEGAVPYRHYLEEHIAVAGRRPVLAALGRNDENGAWGKHAFGIRVDVRPAPPGEFA